MPRDLRFVSSHRVRRREHVIDRLESLTPILLNRAVQLPKLTAHEVSWFDARRPRRPQRATLRRLLTASMSRHACFGFSLTQTLEPIDKHIPSARHSKWSSWAALRSRNTSRVSFRISQQDCASPGTANATLNPRKKINHFPTRDRR